MTITLHWWLIPLAIAILGFVFMWFADRQGGILGGLFEMFGAVVCWVVAIAICITHWLTARGGG